MLAGFIHMSPVGYTQVDSQAIEGDKQEITSTMIEVLEHNTIQDV